MKKLSILIASLLFVVMFTSSSSAQNLKIGGGISYATDLNSVGFSVNANYKISSKLQVAPSFIYFLKKDLVSWYALDLDGHYVLSSNKNFQIFGIVGLGFTFTSIDLGPFGTFSDTNTGINVGAGFTKKLSDKLSLFSEIKYSISSGSYLKIGAGVLFNL